ncbi:hypothetical protein AgCh_022082 [Apium graveolens]
MEKNYISSQTGLQTLAAKPNAFQSGYKLGFWQRIIYSCESFFLGIPISRKKALVSPNRGPSHHR